jgi:hypothetical protein
MMLEIKGFWHEDDAPVKDVEFANALTRGLIRFAKFVGAKKVDVSAIKPTGLRTEVKRVMGKQLSIDR